MSAPRDALAALIRDHGIARVVSGPAPGGRVVNERVCEVCDHGLPWHSWRDALAEHAADVILAAGWTPPTVKPTVEDVARAIYERRAEAAGIGTIWDMAQPTERQWYLDDARAVLGLFGGVS